MRSVGLARTVALLGLMLLLAAAPLRAGSQASLDLRYDLYWGGLRLARLALHHELEPERYATEMAIETVGLIDTLVRWRGHAQVAGARHPTGELAPSTYSSGYEKRNKSRTTSFALDRDTGGVVDLRMTKRGKPLRSNVPPELRRDVVDPLTAILQVRDFAARARIGERAPFRAAVFDGRRRYDVEATWRGRERVSIAGRSWPALRLEARLVAVAGFEDDDLHYAAAGEDDLVLEVLLSDDKRLLPLRVKTLNAAITGLAQLLEDCSAEPGCQLAAR